MAYASPGHTIVEPPLVIPALYVYFFFGAVLLGCAVMRRAKARWPHFGPFRLIGICFVVMMIADLIVEGLIIMPTSVWQYGGGHGAILFPERFHKYPAQEMITAGLTATGMASLRYFLNDRGQLLSERGLDRLAVSKRRTTAVRVLATVAVCHAIVVLCWTLPNTFLAMHQTSWPVDLQKRSYLVNGICGEGTNRQCPGPGVPLTRDDVSPPATKVVPFDRGPLGGSE